MKIAICITTKNRRNTMAMSLVHWNAYKPANADIFIIDDGSPFPLLPGTNIYFQRSVGVSEAKNACLKLSEGYDYVFCADDDFYPVSEHWYVPYINSGLEHACYTFDRKVLQRTETFVEYEKPCGCMLFFTRKCIDTAGGWDSRFKGYGMEHVSLSDRIFNMGLTPARYIDAVGSRFEMAKCETSFTDVDKSHLRANMRLYEQEYNSKQFIPYK